MRDIKKVKTVRVAKSNRVKVETSLSINVGVEGDTIEVMIERLKEGEGEDGITDRDLVYNDNETDLVNPITNIRSDKMELMLEEKVGEYEHRHRKMKVVKDEEVVETPGEETGEEATK